ncbi:unnamed protein product, partial [Cuscuta campestris]
VEIKDWMRSSLDNSEA